MAVVTHNPCKAVIGISLALGLKFIQAVSRVPKPLSAVPHVRVAEYRRGLRGARVVRMLPISRHFTFWASAPRGLPNLASGLISKGREGRPVNPL